MASICFPGLEKKYSFIYYLNLNKSENAINYLIKNPQYIEWGILSANPYAVDLLIENQHLIYWPTFCKNKNPKVIDVLLKNPTKIFWSSLSANPVAIDLLKKNKDKIDYIYLSNNSNAYELIKEYMEREFICTNTDPTSPEYIVKECNKMRYIPDLCYNRNEELIQYLYKNYSKYINWSNLSTNPAAMDILLQNMDKINYRRMSENTHPKAQELMKKNPWSIDWSIFGKHINDYAFILKHNPPLREWFWANPIIFDYKAISKYYMDKVKEELIENSLHPNRIQRWLEQGVEIDDL
jgi:hypothetical protein